MKISAIFLLVTTFFFSSLFLFSKNALSEADTVAPEISNVSVSKTTSSATVTWTTDEAADSFLLYGLTTDYESTKEDSSRVTSHSITVDKLSANTLYFYHVRSTDAAGNITLSPASTFVTDAAASTTPSTTTVTNTVTITKEVIITKTVKDDTPPTIFLDTNFDKSFTVPPKITGRASDSGDINPGINRVEYSVDDGKTWLEVDNLKSPNAKSTSFDFVPAIFEDGNFKLKVRAYDNSGNVTSSQAYTLVIDRLPPQIGGILFSIGPQVISPDRGGVLVVPKGLDIKITLSAVGGASTIDLSANSKKYSLVKNPDSGLWSGMLNFLKSGEYILKSKSVDGAGNVTEKDLIMVNVIESGRVVDESERIIEGAVVSVYYFEPSLAKFVLWDGKPFGQDNPQKVNKEGQYKFLLPAGKYYLQVSKFGYKTNKSNIFTLEDNVAISNKLILKKGRSLQIGPILINLFDFISEQNALTFDMPPGLAQTNKLIGQEMPYFAFKREDQEVNTNSFRGKPALLTFSATWSPKNAEQMYILQKLANNKQINIVPVMVQESISRVSIFEKIGNYNLKILADPDGEMLGKLGIFNLPTHVFLDRKGIIKRIIPGVLTDDELLQNLVN